MSILKSQGGFNQCEPSVDFDDEDTNKQSMGQRLNHMVTDPFTKKYISEPAEKLKKHAQQLEKELMKINENYAIKEFLAEN